VPTFATLCLVQHGHRSHPTHCRSRATRRSSETQGLQNEKQPKNILVLAKILKINQEDLLLVSQSFGEMVVHRWQGVGDIATVWKWGAFEACGVATVLWRREARPWRLL
jgi:hypothetical protein